MTILSTLIKKDLTYYCHSMYCYIYAALFWLVQSFFVFYVSNFLLQQHADSILFFSYIPITFLIFLPGLSLSAWSREKKSGLLESLVTLPIPPYTLVISKFLSQLIILSILLIGTFPFWITLNYLGNPDNFLIFSGYISCFLLGSFFIAIGLMFSILINNDYLSYLSTIITLLILLLGDAIFPYASFFSQILLPFASVLDSIGFFNSMIKGLLYVKDIFLIISSIALVLYLSILFFERDLDNQ